jgi:ubiquinone/menaquinone biosynthesis C-methylase UbiE
LNLLPPEAYSLLMKVFYDQKLKERVRTMLDPREGLTVLDVACGSGDLFDVTHPCRYVGTDIDLRRVDHASTGMAAAHVVSDARALPFRDRSVDRILVAGLFHHLPDAAAGAVLAEMGRVLRPSGRVVVLEATWPRRWYNATGWLARRLDDGRFVRHPRDYERLFEGSFAVRPLEYFSRLTLGFLVGVLESPRTAEGLSSDDVAVPEADR